MTNAPTLTDLADQLSTIRNLNTALYLAAAASSEQEIDALGTLAGIINDKLKVAIASLEEIRRPDSRSSSTAEVL